jgi:hypothetical protein
MEERITIEIDEVPKPASGEDPALDGRGSPSTA